MVRLNYNQLYYFYVIATEGSIKAACEKLHLTQPTISGQLKTLEEDLGQPLFERKYRKLELTSYGRDIYKKAEKIFILGEELQNTCHKNTSIERREVRIGVVPSLPNSLVHNFTTRIWNDRTIAIHISHGELNKLIRDIDEDQLDLILSDAPYGPSKTYKTINLGNQKLLAVGDKKAFGSARQGFPKSLHGLPYISFSRQGQLQEEIDFFFKIHGIKPEIIGSVDDAAFIRSLALTSRCIAVLPEKAVSDDIRNGRLECLGEMEQVISNCWAITSALTSKRLTIRKVINSFLIAGREDSPRPKAEPIPIPFKAG